MALRALRSLLFVALLLPLGAHSRATAQPAASPNVAEPIERYHAVDLDYFARPATPNDGPLYPALRALVRGEAAEAERALREAVDVVPDSLRPFAYDRLAALAYQRFDWEAALRYRAARADAIGVPFDPSEEKASVFAAYPRPSATVPGGSTTVPFDGYRTDGALFGPAASAPVRFFLDTGSPVTLLSRALADRLRLDLEATGGRVSIPARGIDSAPTYTTVIDSVRVGEAVLRNVPAEVIDTDRPIAPESDLFLGFDALAGLLGGVRYGFADSTLTLYAREQTPDTHAEPNFLLGAGYALLSYEADGEPFTGVVDTGSPFSYVYADWWTPPAGTEGRPVTHRGRLADTEYEFTLDYYDLAARIAGAEVEALPLGLSTRGQVGAPFRVMSLLGTGLFADGALVLDFDRRVATYER